MGKGFIVITGPGQQFFRLTLVIVRSMFVSRHFPGRSIVNSHIVWSLFVKRHFPGRSIVNSHIVWSMFVKTHYLDAV